MGTVFDRAACHTELIDGEEVEKPVPKELQAIIQSNLLIALASRIAKNRYRVLPEFNVLCGNDRLEADLTAANLPVS